MNRVDLFSLYQCGGAIRQLSEITADTIASDQQNVWLLGQAWLDWLLDENSEVMPISDAREHGQKLRGFIATFLQLPNGEKIGAPKHRIFSTVLKHFESVLSAELGRLHVYSITTLLGYDTDVLLGNGRAVLPRSTLDWLPEDAAIGFDEGTRALVLRQATAAGFLFLRAVEDVMHNYYDVISSNTQRPKRRNMGDYIDALEKIPAVRPEMLEVLRSIKNLRRNPLMHPEHRLKMDDAIAIFDVAKSAISAMARQAKEHAAKNNS
jgi:hypothetical protein